MSFVSKSGVSASASNPDDRKTVVRLLNAARSGVDVAFRSLTLDTLLVRGTTRLGSTLLVTGGIKGGSGQSSVPLGTLGYAEQLNTQAAIAAEINLTGLSVVVNVSTGGRRIRISQQTFPGAPSVTPVTVTTNIKDEGFNYLMQSNVTLSSAGANATCYSSRVLVPTPGKHTYFLTMSAGAGTVSNSCNATFRSFILVEDIGT